MRWRAVTPWSNACHSPRRVDISPARSVHAIDTSPSGWTAVSAASALAMSGTVVPVVAVVVSVAQPQLSSQGPSTGAVDRVAVPDTAELFGSGDEPESADWCGVEPRALRTSAIWSVVGMVAP